jgi:7-cyano-7-deazaguanine tRNA-ribosyltransferase
LVEFEIKDRDAAGRICKFKTRHGTVETPALLPVINPNKMIITPREMRELFHIEMIITNSYIIYKNKELKEKALTDGIHKLIDFDGPIMTDSGTFQSYIYGDIDVDPLEIVEFQRDIGSDVGTILDVFTFPDENLENARKKVIETIRRAKESLKIKGEMFLACTIQGSIYPKLREICAKKISKLNSDFYPIGGVVPLMENQIYSNLAEIIIASKMGLDPSKPVHLFGAGHPIIFPLAVALGCDFFDSSAYAKYASDERIIMPWGTLKLEDLDELPCSCPVCSRYDVKELKALNENKRFRLLAEHNLYVSISEIRRIKQAIKEGSLWELVERRAYANPYLMDALRILEKKKYKKWLELFESISKKRALFYTGRYTIHRPIIYRYHKRLFERYKPNYNKVMILPEGNKPYSKYYNSILQKLSKFNNLGFIVDSYLGPVPIELDEMYPIAQSVVPEYIDIETKKKLRLLLRKFLKNFKVISQEDAFSLARKEKVDCIDLNRVKATVCMQFGKDADKALLKGNIKIVKSKSTGKIRNVYSDNEHILSMRASDGLFTLKIAGGKRLHKFFKYPYLRVAVKDECRDFILEGKSVFSKFVVDCDPELRPMDECLIVDEKDNLLAVGRCLLNRLEMLSFNYGMAVKTREQM